MTHLIIDLCRYWPGRAGKLGKGVLILSPFEKPFLKELEAAGLLSDCPLDPELSVMLGAAPASNVGARLARWRPTKGSDSLKVAAKAYQAFLGCDTAFCNCIQLTQAAMSIRWLIFVIPRIL